MPRPISIDHRDVLLAIDLQADFTPGGALAVEGGDEIVPLVNRLAARFENVVVTQDWHPPTHASFAASHEDAKPFDTKTPSRRRSDPLAQHCVQDTLGVVLHPDLALDRAFLILRKGMQSAVDFDRPSSRPIRKTTTGLAALLKARADQAGVRLRPRPISASPIRRSTRAMRASRHS